MYFAPPNLNLATGLVAAKRGLKLRQKNAEAEKRKVDWISLTERLSMPHHTEDGDNVGNRQPA